MGSAAFRRGVRILMQGANPAVPETTSKPQTDQSRSERRIPDGWVKIVNRSTGLVLGGQSAVWRIEPAGDCYRLRKQKSNQYAALAEWAKTADKATDRKGRPRRLLEQVADAQHASLWKIAVCDDGCWTISNRDSGKCLEAPKDNASRVVRQAAMREGDAIQKWSLEPATAAKDSGNKTASVDAETRPAAERLADQELDSDRLAIGDTGTIACAYAEILKIIDDRSCIVVPYTYHQVTDYTNGDPVHGNQYVVSSGYKPHLPVVLRGWPTAGKVTGQKDDLADKVFRVTGTEDMKKTDGTVIRVHVLELASSPSK